MPQFNAKDFAQKLRNDKDLLTDRVKEYMSWARFNDAYLIYNMLNDEYDIITTKNFKAPLMLLLTVPNVMDNKQQWIEVDSNISELLDSVIETIENSTISNKKHIAVSDNSLSLAQLLKDTDENLDELRKHLVEDEYENTINEAWLTLADKTERSYFESLTQDQKEIFARAQAFAYVELSLHEPLLRRYDLNILNNYLKTVYLVEKL